MAQDKMIGRLVPFLLGMPSVKARVIGKTKNDQYVLFQQYTTQNSRGEWIDVEKTYYRDCYYIRDYWSDTVGPASNQIASSRHGHME